MTMRRTPPRTMPTQGAGLVLALAAAVVLLAPAASRAQDFPERPPKAPLGLPPVFWPTDNRYSKEKAELGRLLYFDTRLSADNSVSCASCHEPSKAFTDWSAVSTGIGGQTGGRSAPTVINRAYSTLQFWDGRARTLEDQAKGPLANPIEMTDIDDMDEAHKAVIGRIRGIPGYETLFKAAFGNEDVTINHVAKAIATYERTVLSGNAPYDRYKAGDKTAMSESQVRGMKLFTSDRLKCDSCHLGFNFTDGSYENVGIGMNKPDPDLGRFVLTGREEEKGAFKTPTLREIEHTSPYMHDGSLATLEDVVEHYNQGGIDNPWLSDRIVPLNLTDQEKADLVAFMKALSGEGWQHHTPPAPDEFPK